MCLSNYAFFAHSEEGGRVVYMRRKTIVEPVFGQIKQAQGFRHFLLRGLDKGPRRMGAGLRHAQSAETLPSLHGMK